MASSDEVALTALVSVQACSYNCHEGHDLVELYTKRAFRCDCGNSKFPSGTLQARASMLRGKNPIPFNLRAVLG